MIESEHYKQKLCIFDTFVSNNSKNQPNPPKNTIKLKIGTDVHIHA